MRLAPLLALASCLVLAAPAAAVDRYVPMKVPPAPGPAKYDKVFVQQLGPADARNVLVLVPGTNGGAGGVTPVARDIVQACPEHAGMDRRPPRAGLRGHRGVRPARS